MAPYPIFLYDKATQLLQNIWKRITKPLTYKALIQSLQCEILEDYMLAVKESILRYVLQDPYEKLRLNLNLFPRRYPTIVIRAPMPWHTPFTMSKQKLSYIYFQGSCILLELKKIWDEKQVLFFVCNCEYLYYII